jgi:hypothetical protein
LILYIGSPNGNSEPSEKEIKKTSPLIIWFKRSWYKFNKGGERSLQWKVQNIEKRNREDTNKLEDINCSCIVRINIIKMFIVYK